MARSSEVTQLWQLPQEMKYGQTVLFVAAAECQAPGLPRQYSLHRVPASWHAFCVK